MSRLGGWDTRNGKRIANGKNAMRLLMGLVGAKMQYSVISIRC